MENETRKTIALNLRMLRVNKGLKQHELAENIGTTREIYAQYEMGNRNPDAEFLFNLSTLAGIRMETFFEADPDKFMNELVYNEFTEDGDRELLQIYRRLTPFSRGRLLERATALEEKDAENEAQLKAFRNRLSK